MSATSRATRPWVSTYISGNQSSLTAAWPQFNTSNNNEESAIDCEDIVDVNSTQSNYQDSNNEEELYSESEADEEYPADTLSPDMSSTASASFLQLQGQMLQLFEDAQSQAVDLRQHVNQLEEQNLEIGREKEAAYETREAELLSRIEELVHEVERLSDQLVAKDQDNSQDELLQENARLVAKVDSMATAWTENLSAINEETKEKARILVQYYRQKIASLKGALSTIRQNIEDHPTTKFLRTQNAEYQHRLKGLEEHIAILESKKAAPPRKRKKPAKSATASENLRKLVVADWNSEFGKKLEEKDRIAKSQAANMEQTVSKLRQRIAELERPHSTIMAGYSPVVHQAQQLEHALDKVARLQMAVEERNHTIEKQEHVLEEYRERYQLLKGCESSLAEQYVTCENEPVQNPAAATSLPHDSFGEETSSTSSEDQLEIEEQIPADDPKSEGKLENFNNSNAELQEEVETLRQQFQSLQQKYNLFHERDKKWRNLIKKFMHHAPNIQLKDASKRQIKKGFKYLQKIVKEGEVQGI